MAVVRTGFGSKPPKKIKRTTQVKRTERSTPRPRTTDMSDRELQRLLKPLAEASDAREELKEEYKEKVLEANLAAIAASEAGVPLKDIVEAGRFTRQNFYQVERAYNEGKLNGKPKAPERTIDAKKSSNPRKRTIPEKKSMPVRRTSKTKKHTEAKRTKVKHRRSIGAR